MAGDYVGSYEDLLDLGRTPAGREQLAQARWSALYGDDPGPSAPPPPTGDARVRRAVTDEYFALLARNTTHFSAEAANWREYSRWHASALAEAVVAGPRGERRPLAAGLQP